MVEKELQLHNKKQNSYQIFHRLFDELCLPISSIQISIVLNIIQKTTNSLSGGPITTNIIAL